MGMKGTGYEGLVTNEIISQTKASFIIKIN